jgi:hypothetical protein
MDLLYSVYGRFSLKQTSWHDGIKPLRVLLSDLTLIRGKDEFAEMSSGSQLR